MSLKIAFQMDPMEGILVHKDSSFALAMEAQRRGYSLYHYIPSALQLKNGQVLARANKMKVFPDQGRHFTFEAPEILDLRHDIDLVLLRQDPPFDLAYITSTHILDHIKHDTLVLNDPTEVRNAPEKLLVTHFQGLTPPTLITSDTKAMAEFYREHGDIILKPLYGNGGSQIIRVEEHSENLNALLEMFSMLYREPFIAQKYLPAVREGDKRIILIDGRPAGAMLRVPAKGETRSNLHVGGTPVKCGLTPRDEEICAAIGGELKRRGLVFVGIDVIGEYLTEINVTSPTGIVQINALNGIHLQGELWDSFESRLKKFKQGSVVNG